jgi:hypothetical protein
MHNTEEKNKIIKTHTTNLFTYITKLYWWASPEMKIKTFYIYQGTGSIGVVRGLSSPCGQIRVVLRDFLGGIRSACCLLVTEDHSDILLDLPCKTRYIILS